MAMSMINASGCGHIESGTNLTTAPELEYPGIVSGMTTISTDTTEYNGARSKDKQSADRSSAGAAKLRSCSRKGRKGVFLGACGSRKERKGSLSEPVAENNSNAWRCESCEKIFRKYNDMILECEFCTKHLCIKCVKCRPSECETMAKPECMWFCLNEKKIEERCMFYCHTINDRLDAIERKVNNKCDEEKVKEILIEMGKEQPQLQTQNKAQTDGRDRVLKDTVKEVNDQKTRKTNFIVFRAPEINTK